MTSSYVGAHGTFLIVPCGQKEPAESLHDVQVQSSTSFMWPRSVQLPVPKNLENDFRMTAIVPILQL